VSRVAYVNGRYVPHRHAMVHVEDRGLQFADGVYEVIHVHGGAFVDADRHLARLERSLGEISVPMPMPRRTLFQVLREVARRNRLGADGLVYVQVTRGVAKRDFGFPPPGTAATLVVTARRIPAYPADAERWTATCITYPDQRWARRDIKSTALLPSVLAKQAARERGAFEALLVDGNGLITEGSSSTAWIVDERGALRTRQIGHEILPGCTRAALIALLGEAGIPFEERAFSEAELRRAREAFLTSATNFVKPVVAVDGAPVGDGRVGPVARRLFTLFGAHVASACPQGASR
jgi:D-alanine transaminase